MSRRDMAPPVDGSSFAALCAMSFAFPAGGGHPRERACRTAEPDPPDDRTAAGGIARARVETREIARSRVGGTWRASSAEA